MLYVLFQSSIFEFAGCPNIIIVNHTATHVCLHWMSVIRRLKNLIKSFERKPPPTQT